MTTYEQWRVTGTLRIGVAYATPYATEDFARRFIDRARQAQTFTDGPHLERRTVTVTDWEPA
jgi:hypothetical protein